MFPGLWHRSIGPMVHEVATFSKPKKRCLSHGTACQSLSIFCIQNSQCSFLEHQGTTTIWEVFTARHLSLFVFGPICSVECFHRFGISISHYTE
jgi:hypothetical protein